MLPNLDFPNVVCVECTESHFDCSDHDKNRLIEALATSDPQTVHPANRAAISKILRNISDRDNCEKSKLLAKIKDLTGRTEEAQSQIRDSEKALEGLRQEVAKLDPLLRELEEKDLKIEELKEQMKAINDALISRVSDEEQRKSNALVLLGQIREQKQEIADLKHEIDDRNFCIWDREQSIERLAREERTLTHQVEAKDNEIEDLRRDIDEGNSQLLSRNKEIDSLQKQINEKDRQIGARDSQIQGRSDVMKKLLERLEQMKSRLASADEAAPERSRERVRTEAFDRH
ncbi:uncharacterized protein BDZ99DRAFT_570461 [Mytilinidion resinicola]|uniref:Uncharacterized protein n=1 Tax=Mytilinidion resinicola TaxID=574789 RepID=A0A6A6YQN6_9PEZI|nr:uncharacterized protein BDZ99DRAFT_570461 [Mytilinidion resinicola]KAF2811212.1 hypothetical protein BDZ99DRAFT_570461 [Mytilinidion resinicola]